MAVRVSPRGVGRDTPDGPRRSARRVTPGTPSRFVAAIEQLYDGTPVVSVMGDVDLATVRALEQTLGVAEAQTGGVIVDLMDCTLLDSRGLRALVATRRRLQRSNRRLALVLANPSVLKIFQITHFDELFEIYPSLSAAIDRAGNFNGDGDGDGDGHG